MRVCMVGKFDPAYPRHAIIRAGLERAGHQVMQQRYPKSLSVAALIPRLARDVPRLAREVDGFLIPAFNRLQAPAIWLMARLARKPVWLDYMIGLSDADEDRGAASPIKQWVYRQVDRFNIRSIASFTDTAAHRDHFARTLGVSTRRMSVVPVGAREELLDFQPATPTMNGKVVVQYVGSYIPFHGLDVILRAAHMLRDDERIAFELIGNGQGYEQAHDLADKLGLDNATFVRGFYGMDDLLRMLGREALFLGVFGDAEKTRYVVPNKVYDGMAMGLPVLTADGPALHEFFTPGEHLATVPPGDPAALAGAIRALAGSPGERTRLGAAGRARIREAFLPERIGRQISVLIERT